MDTEEIHCHIIFVSTILFMVGVVILLETGGMVGYIITLAGIYVWIHLLAPLDWYAYWRIYKWMT